MKLKINGKDYDFEEQNINVNDILSKLNITKTVIVELNGEIIKKSEFDKVQVEDGNNIEILYFMGGG